MHRHLSLLATLAFAFGLATARADLTFDLQDHLGQDWQHELVTYRLAAGTALPQPAVLAAPDGAVQPVQVRAMPDGTTEVAFIVAALGAGQQVRYTLKAGEPAASAALARAEGGALVLDAGTVAARVPAAGRQEFAAPVPLAAAPPPLLAVRGLSGAWLGQGRMAGDATVKAVTTTLVAAGPVYAEARTDYELTDGRYSCTVRVIAGDRVVLLADEFDTTPAARERAWWQFSLREGLDPRRLCVQGRLWRERPDKRETPAGTDYALTGDADRREVSLIGYVCWWPETTRVLAVHGDATSDVVACFPRRIGQWRNPTGAYLETRKDGQVFLSWPLYVLQEWTRDGIDMESPYYTGRLEEGWPRSACRRQYALYLGDRPAVFPAAEGARSDLAAAVVRHSDMPLDKLKDWTFAWDTKGVTYPRLYTTAKDLPELRKRALAEPVWAADLGHYYDRPETWLLRADPKTGDDLVRLEDDRPSWSNAAGCVPGLRRFVRQIVAKWGYVGFAAPNNAQPMIELLRFDAAMSVTSATPAERAEMQRLIAFVAQLVADQDWHPTLAGWHLGNPNMPPRQEHHLGVASALLPTHPQAPAWRARGEAELFRLLRTMTRPSGAWRECPHYQWEAAFYPMCQSAVPIRLSGGADIFADPQFKATWTYLLHLLTPPSPRFRAGGVALRELPAFGNGSWEFVPLFGWIAAMTRDTDPAFSRAMQWAWHEQGRPYYSDNSRLVIDPKLPGEEPVLRSANFTGFGSVMRSGFPSARETWMAFRHGDCIEHYNYGDQGSFMLYARGAPLVTHLGSTYQPYMQGAWHFNRACVNHRPVRPDDPVAAQLGDRLDDFHLGTELWAEDGSNDYVMHNRAWVSLGAADYSRGEQLQQWQGVIGKDPTIKMPPNTPLLRADIPDTRYTRQMLFLKDADPDAPNYFVIRDDFAGEAPPPGEWNLYTVSSRVEAKGAEATATGLYGVDLQVAMVEPANPAWDTTPLMESTFQPSHSQGRYTGGKWKETLPGLRVQAPSGTGFMVVLYPRRPDEPAAQVSALADGKGVKVVHPKGTDYVFLGPAPVTWEGDGLAFTGRAGAIRKPAVGGATVVFAEPGQARVGAAAVHRDAPAEVAVGAP